MFRMPSFYLATGLGLLTWSIFAAPVPSGPTLTEFKDPKNFFPNRNHQELKGTVIGLLLTDGQQILNLEGRSGPTDQLVLSLDGGSYRWVYAPETPAQIGTLTLETLNGKKAFPNLSMCNPRTAKQWGVKEGYTLVEVEVNDGDGSPKGDAFAATKMKVIEDSKEFPLKASAVIADAQKRNEARLKQSEKDLNKALADLAEKALKGRKATGPKETQSLMYATWMNKEKELQVRFKTTIKDGSFTEVQGGAGIDGPFPLPPAPGGGEKLPSPSASPTTASCKGRHRLRDHHRHKFRLRSDWQADPYRNPSSGKFYPGTQSSPWQWGPSSTPVTFTRTPWQTRRLDASTLLDLLKSTSF